MTQIAKLAVYIENTKQFFMPINGGETGFNITGREKLRVGTEKTWP